MELSNINEGESAFIFARKIFFSKRRPLLQVLLCVAVAAFQVSHHPCLEPDFQFYCTDTCNLNERIYYISWQKQTVGFTVV